LKTNKNIRVNNVTRTNINAFLLLVKVSQKYPGSSIALHCCVGWLSALILLVIESYIICYYTGLHDQA